MAEGELNVTALDWYILFAIGFAIFALWVIREADAARRRLRERNEQDEMPRACGRCNDEETER
jgi:hypothetical protein